MLERLDQLGRSAARPRADLGEAGLDRRDRRVGERVVQQLRAAGGVLHHAHEAVDLVGDLGVGQVGALDRVADALLATLRLEHLQPDRRRERVDVELLARAGEPLAALGPLAREHAVGLVAVEERARAGGEVDDQRDDQHQQPPSR